MRQLSQVILCRNQDVVLCVADQMAYERTLVMTDRDDWYIEDMHSYGALFLGQRNNVANGSKVIGTDHMIQIRGAGRSTGGICVGKLLKMHSYQWITGDVAVAEMVKYAPRVCTRRGFVDHAEQRNLQARPYGGHNVPYGAAVRLHKTLD